MRIRDLAFVSSSVSYRAEGDDAGVWVNAGLGRLIEALGRRVERLRVLLSYTRQRQDQHDHRVDLSADAISFLPPMAGIAEGLTMGRKVRAAIASVERTTEVTVVQLPFSAPLALLRAQAPRLYHVVGDIVTSVDASTRYRGVQRIAARAAARSIDFTHARLIRSEAACAVTHGAALFQRYGGRGRAIVSSTLLDGEVNSVSRMRGSGGPFRVLFVGFMRPEKGIDVLLDAFNVLAAGARTLELVIVGGVDVAAGVAEEISERVAVLSSRVSVHTKGAIPFGPALFQEYADADVLVVPSRSEGTPRVLVEARAFGCPVIGSRVGGIPSSIEDGVDGLLVPPDDVGALVRAIERVRDDASLRGKLIERGFERARRTTVEAQAQAIVDEAEALLARCRGKFSEASDAA